MQQSLAVNTVMKHHYYELQRRDMENSEDLTGITVSVAKSFLWNRDFALRWDLTKNLKMNFVSATHAEVEEPYGVLNRNIDPDSYEARKDTIRRSLLSFGRPIDYQQTFNASYKLPFDKLPLTDWITADARFSSSYNWARGVALIDGVNLGNTASNQRSFDVSSRINFETLYNKSKYLKAVNKKFASSTSNRNRNTTQPKKKEKPKRFEREIELKKDTTVTVRHGLGSRKPRISALSVDGNRYPIRYKVIDANTIRIETQDSTRIKLTAIEGPKPEDNKWYKVGQSASRFAMMIRNVSITYKNTYAMMLPGFLPEIGDMLGQHKGPHGFTPGLGFAFGMTGNSYIDKAIKNGWLSNDSLVSPATTNSLEDVQVRVALEPIRDLKIDLTASRTRNQSNEIQFMFAGKPSYQSGNFNMSIISIGSAFERHHANNGYASKSFTQFLNNLEIVQERVQNLYAGATVPSNVVNDNGVTPNIGNGFSE